MMGVRGEKLRAIAPLAVVFYVLAIVHGVFAWSVRDRRPDFTVLLPPPAPAVREAATFGDRQFLYRVWALDLQNAGDTGGRATPMRDYNYDYVVGWLEALRHLDGRAHFHTFLAVRYFSNTPRQDDVRKVVRFVVDDVQQNADIKWYWLTQATQIVRRRLSDEEYGLQIAQLLASYDYPNMPSWTWLFPAILLENLGQRNEALAVIADVRRRKAGRLEPETLLWMSEFEHQRLNQN